GQTPIPADSNALEGGRRTLAFVLSVPLDALTSAIVVFSLFFVLRIVTRRAMLATLGLMIFITLAFFGGENFALETPNSILTAAVVALTTARFGLLATAFAFVFFKAFAGLPLPLDLSLPYGTTTLLLGLGLLAIVIYA